MGYSPVVLDVPVGGAFEYIFVVLNMVVEPTDLLFEAADFNVFLGVASGNGCEEPFVMARRMSALRSGCAASVVTTVLGDIGGSGLSTGRTGRGAHPSVGEVLEGLIEPFEDIWATWRNWADARKLK